MKTLSSVVRPYDQIDRLLKSQGFRSTHHYPPTYDTKIRDIASGQVYRLKVPTYLTGKKIQKEYLQLDEPVLEPDSNNRCQSPSNIPDSVVFAVHEKLEEIASYLKS
jgi:hypothetical protein